MQIRCLSANTATDRRLEGNGMNRERQISALEAAVDAERYLKATRPSGKEWEDHLEWYLEFDPDDSEAAQFAAVQALQDWYDAK